MTNHAEMPQAGLAPLDAEAGRAQSERARRSYLARRRHDILAPVNALIEVTGLLMEDEPVRSRERLFRDLETVQKTARRMAQMVEAMGRPGDPEGDTARALNHDLRSLLTIVLGYAGDLRRFAAKQGLDELVEEFEQVRFLGQRVQSLVDSTVSRLRSPEGGPPIDDLQRYLDRMAVESESCEDAAPSIEPGLILVAEDHDRIRELLCRDLRDQGHEVVTACDGLEALMIVSTRAFDLILTDIEMPRANGFQVLENLKADPARRDIPVVVVSGHGDLNAIAHCIKMGAEDYLPKPYNRAILRARVDACLEKKRLRDRNEYQRRRYEELLHSILPAPVVVELTQTNSVRPRRREAVAVFFADIVGFTTYCDRHQDQPEIVVQHLRRMFEAWEEMASGLGVQKIKTIGDAFMAASGLLEDHENPVLSCVRLGLGMIEFTQGLHDEEGRHLGFNLRVGIHVGPVVAGVLGRRQSLYDLWGDTVNTASRLESQGRPGCVNLSAVAWGRVAEFYGGEDHEVIKVKGKPAPMEIVHLDPSRIDVRAAAVATP